MAVNGVRLFGVIMLSGREGPPLPQHPYARTRTMIKSPVPLPSTSIIRFRELGAVVAQTPFTAANPNDGELGRYTETIDAHFESGTIYPAPFGTVFRSTDLVERWLEMNYIALAEGIHFIHGRCEARVHVDGKEKLPADADTPDVGELAIECFRALRRHAMASVPLRKSDASRRVSNAFLVGRAQWDEFGDYVEEQGKRYTNLVLETTGPWPPYDFVHMDLVP